MYKLKNLSYPVITSIHGSLPWHLPHDRQWKRLPKAALRRLDNERLGGPAAGRGGTLLRIAPDLLAVLVAWADAEVTDVAPGHQDMALGWQGSV